MDLEVSLLSKECEFHHIASKGQDKLIIKQICATSLSGCNVGFPLLTLMGSMAVKVICYFFYMDNWNLVG